MAEQKSSSALAAPLRGAASVLRRVPGAGVVGRAAQGTLDKVGAVSPRGRRLVVYTGAGVLGVAGVVEWPVALTGAAVAWLTQSRPEHADGPGRPGDGGQRTPALDTGATAGKRAAATVKSAKDVAGAALSSTAGAKAGGPGHEERPRAATGGRGRSATAKSATATTSAARTAAARTTAVKSAAARTSAVKSATARTSAVRSAARKAAATTSAAKKTAGTTSAAAKTTDTTSAAKTSPSRAGTSASRRTSAAKSSSARPAGSQAGTGPLGPTARRGRTA